MWRTYFPSEIQLPGRGLGNLRKNPWNLLMYTALVIKGYNPEVKSSSPNDRKGRETFLFWKHKFSRDELLKHQVLSVSWFMSLDFLGEWAMPLTRIKESHLLFFCLGPSGVEGWFTLQTPLNPHVSTPTIPPKPSDRGLVMLHISTRHVDIRHNKRHKESVDCREVKGNAPVKAWRKTAKTVVCFFFGVGGGVSMLRNIPRRWGETSQKLRLCVFFGGYGENVTPFQNG